MVVEAERMPDESDVATSTEEAERERQIMKIRQAAREPSLKPIGICYYCGEEVSAPHIFCDRDCADGYEQLLAARRRNNGGNYSF